VTAATSGIGRCVAQRLTDEGASVFVTGFHSEHVDEAASALGAKGSAVIDLGAPDGGSAAATAALEVLGGVDLLVSNTGAPRPAPFVDLSDDDWLYGFHLLLGSAIQLTRAVLPSMVAAGWGRIVYLSSTGALRPLPRLHLSNVLRAGLGGLARSITNEVAPSGITANVVAPAAVKTNRLDQIMAFRAEQSGRQLEDVLADELSTIPAGRWGTPDDVAAVVSFLCSQEAGYLTSGTYCVDGGSATVSR
jgi:3-oxoacyl-[acyl-carrier protein] reductase